MKGSNARTSSIPPVAPAAASSQLRPRPRRLISGFDDGDDLDLQPTSAISTRAASPISSLSYPRAVSPIPTARLSRPQAQNRTQASRHSSAGGGGTGTGQRTAGNESPTALAALWGSSWNTLQEIASDLLSGDATANAKAVSQRTRRPLNKPHGHRSASRASTSPWGPAMPTSHLATSSIGAGTGEEQLAALRAQKRRDMLTRQEPSYSDTLGNVKRRLSDEHISASAPPGENEDRDVLVYVHEVQKHDTLAGLTIKYNCSANVLRKANRMWPNDTVQTRQVIILPVDACGVKGRHVPNPEAIDLLSTDSDALAAGQAEEIPPPAAVAINSSAYTNNNNRHRTNSVSTNTSRRPSSSVAMSSLDGTEQPWHHDSYVLLPNAEKPTQIARLSRRALSYFPPARRKSVAYSDSTQSTSLDLTRSPPNSPLRQDGMQRPQRTRRLSNANNGYFPSYLAGPGGVGSMGGNVRCPGPAQDGLNKMFAKHLPDVAPPRTQQSLLTPEMPIYTDDLTPVASGATTPNTVKNLNLENVGGAIEGWMRRMATSAKKQMDSNEREISARTSIGAPGRGRGGVGDLIEMTDEFEIGENDGEEDEGGSRGSEPLEPSVIDSTYSTDTNVRERLSKGGKKD